MISSALQSQVESQLRQRGLVVWLDKTGCYSSFVDSLKQQHQSGRFFAPVVTFRGSFLQTLMELEPFQDGLDPEPLLLHVPGHTDGSIRETPLLATYKAGRRYERALDTLIREVAAGRVDPEETERFLAGPELTVEAAESWLAQREQGQTGLAQHLQSLQPEWVLESLVQKESDLKARLTPAELPVLRAYLARHTGFSPEFERFFLGKVEAQNETELTEALVGWLMCVEYVHDLNRTATLPELAVLKKLSPPLQKTSVRLTGILRERSPKYYRSQAQQAENLLESELKGGNPDELGKIDTFSREDSRLLEGAVECLQAENWSQALKWAKERLDSPSVWVKNEPSRRQEWTLVQFAATLGQALVRSKRILHKVSDLAQAVERYAGSGKGERDDGAQAVDRAHRELEQARLRLLTSQLPHYALLYDALAKVRALYREWVDELHRDFADLCARTGFLPHPDLQQRNLYEQEVHPLTQQGETRVAFFMVDALRYEMASELANSLQDDAESVHLSARLAELPSITAVGMNVLAPVSREGLLTLHAPFTGFRAGEYLVSAKEHRLRAMGERSLERHPGERRTPTSFSLMELGQISPEKLKKKLKSAALIVVHSREIDGGGEADVGLAAFDQWVGQLRSAVLNLRAAGVEEFVISSDHGFLLLDETVQPVTYNSGKIDRRFIITKEAIKEDHMTTVSLDALGYRGHEGYLMFLREARVFDSKGKSASTFVHGGNSLQERVIPVLRVSYRRSRELNLNRYRLTAESLSPVMNCSRVRVSLEKINSETGVLDYAPGEKVTVALRVLDMPAHVVIKDAPDAELLNQQLLLEADKACEVFFIIQGSAGGKAAIELYHPDGVKEVEPCRPKARFPVDDMGFTAPAPVSSTSWEEELPDGVREVFVHLHEHGMISEAEVLGMLGGARQARKFSTEFEKHLQILPFGVKYESHASGKRWVKE